MNDLEKLSEDICQVAVEAGKAILEIYNSDEFGTVLKSDESPLTMADQKSNAIICTSLKRLTPSIPVISEENKEIPFSTRKEFSTFWLVDPLDGTKEFVKRNGEFTVNIALVREGGVVMGVVYVPVTGELFWAIKELGAFMRGNGNNAPPDQLQAAKFTMKDRGLNVVCSRSHISDQTQKFIDQLNDPEKVSKGSSLKFLILAQGQAHLYPRLGPTMEWDTAAAQIILEEAGGEVIDTVTTKPLIYNKESLLNPHFIAYGNVR